MKINDKVILENHLPQFDRLVSKGKAPVVNDSSFEKTSMTLENIVEQAEKAYIAQVMKEYGNNKTKAAKHMDISLRSLYYKLEKYGFE
jgi:transcriptional regulator with PAS, ATPase and Fis domain